MRRAKAADIENNNRLNFITLFELSLLENRCRTARALNLSFDVGRVARFRRIGMICAEILYHIPEPDKNLAFGVRRLA
jgi:hypothetical protein